MNWSSCWERFWFAACSALTGSFHINRRWSVFLPDLLEPKSQMGLFKRFGISRWSVSDRSPRSILTFIFLMIYKVILISLSWGRWREGMEISLSQKIITDNFFLSQIIVYFVLLLSTSSFCFPFILSSICLAFLLASFFPPNICYVDHHTSNAK